MSGLAGAAETAGPISRLHAQQSFDPADFAVPTGREEQWGFRACEPGGFMASGGVVTMAGLAGRGGRCWKLEQPLLPAAVTGRPVYR